MEAAPGGAQPAGFSRLRAGGPREGDIAQRSEPSDKASAPNVGVKLWKITCHGRACHHKSAVADL